VLYRFADACAGVSRLHHGALAPSVYDDTRHRRIAVKQKLGDTNALYPLVTAIVGATVEGRPNFATVAHLGIASLKSVTLGMGKSHLTNAGIREHRTFSVNLPSEPQVEITDYLGMTSGAKVDKSVLFTVSYGELETAPLIDETPVSMECRLLEHVELPTHDLFVGEIVATYADVGVLTNGHIDIARLRPLLFDMASKRYWSLGEPVARCWSVGKDFAAARAAKEAGSQTSPVRR
jgi:flavin reductase (DIM6/NTAB) family NADH-FMN oxidoreductase RutF